jgi:hypothetical protein
LADYLVVNRFDDEFGEYHRFTEPGDRLAYLTTAGGLPVLDTASALDTVVVPDLSYPTLAAATARMIRRHGRFDAFIGMSEWDLMTVARLSEEFGAGGWNTELVSRFRDKPLMKRLVARAGLPVPRYLALGARPDAAAIAARLGLPLVVKPRDGAASAGVTLAASVAGLAATLAGIGDPAGFECEEFIDSDIFHVDGVRRDGRYHFVTASAYVGNCLKFAGGEPLGSVLLAPGAERDETIAFAAACLDALGLRDGAFHLELFGGDGRERVFLEVALRPGGAEVPFLHRELFGVDLFGEAFRATVGGPPHTPASQFRIPPGGGWGLAAEPRPLPSRLLSRPSLLGSVPTLYAEVLPEPGEVFDGTGGYWHVGGRFRFAGQPAEVRRDVRAVLEGYRMTCEAAVPVR